MTFEAVIAETPVLVAVESQAVRTKITFYFDVTCRVCNDSQHQVRHRFGTVLAPSSLRLCNGVYS
jgi:hypothetical protein